MSITRIKPLTGPRVMMITGAITLAMQKRLNDLGVFPDSSFDEELPVCAWTHASGITVHHLGRKKYFRFRQLTEETAEAGMAIAILESCGISVEISSCLAISTYRGRIKHSFSRKNEAFCSGQKFCFQQRSRNQWDIVDCESV